jgi:hypothetical protein
MYCMDTGRESTHAKPCCSFQPAFTCRAPSMYRRNLFQLDPLSKTNSSRTRLLTRQNSCSSKVQPGTKTMLVRVWLLNVRKFTFRVLPPTCGVGSFVEGSGRGTSERGGCRLGVKISAVNPIPSTCRPPRASL